MLSPCGSVNRMRAASVLIVNLRGLATEVCKNIVLAGIGSLTIYDPTPLSYPDLGAGYFFRDDDVAKQLKRAEAGRPRIQALNPRVEVIAVTEPTELDEKFLGSFDLICLTDSDPITIASRY